MRWVQKARVKASSTEYTSTFSTGSARSASRKTQSKKVVSTVYECPSWASVEKGSFRLTNPIFEKW